jgi:hypothetical protein
MCHGGEQNGTGAPPRPTWGNAGDPLRVGAHSKHVGTTLTAPIDCGTCHPKPADAFTSGHLGEGTADVIWGGRAVTGGAQPAWDRGAGTCATTYCHGNYTGVFTYTDWDDSNADCFTADPPPECVVTKTANYVGNNATVGWDGGPMTCGSCHGNPPSGYYWHSPIHGSLPAHRECQTCHPDASSVNGGTITLPARHVDGTIDVMPKWGAGCSCH